MMVNNIGLNKRKRTPSSPPTPGSDRDGTGRPIPKRHHHGAEDENEDEEASTAAGYKCEDETMKSDLKHDERPASTGEQFSDEGSLWRAREDHSEGTSAFTPEYGAKEAGFEDHFEEHPKDAELSEYTPSSSLWFEDGNFVLRAGGTAFRVHTSVLSRQSEVFRNIFSNPNELDKIDGVAVRGDDPRDVAMLLETMYGFISLTPGQSISFETVSACLRLGTSYQVETIRQAAYEILRSCYPSTLQELDRTDFEPPYRLMGTDMPDFEVVLLAHGQGLNHILVMALYRCCSIKPWEFVDRLELDEGPGEQTPEPALPYGKKLLRKYLCGRADLVRLCATYSLGFLDGATSNTCQSPQTCRRELECLVVEAHRARLLFDNACALQCQDDFIDEATHKMDVCISCYKYLKMRHREGREKVLAMLPEIFRVWGEAQI